MLCWLATRDSEGWPSVSPKEIFALQGDDRIVIADIASGNSVRNLRADPRVCVSFVDIFRQKGFKVYGRAEIHPAATPEACRLGADLFERAGSDYPVRHVIAVTAERVARVKAPSYTLYPDTTEAEMVAQAHATYGVQKRA